MEEIKMKAPDSITTDNGRIYSSVATWDELIKNLYSNSNNVDDKIIKEKLTEKINEVLDTDETIDIMKRYLFRFIEENIDNPENLVKELLKEKDEELNKCKQELESCKKEIRDLENKLNGISMQLQYLFPSTTPITPYPPYGNRDIFWGTSSGTYTIN